MIVNTRRQPQKKTSNYKPASATVPAAYGARLCVELLDWRQTLLAFCNEIGLQYSVRDEETTLPLDNDTTLFVNKHGRPTSCGWSTANQRMVFPESGSPVGWLYAIAHWCLASPADRALDGLGLGFLPAVQWWDRRGQARVLAIAWARTLGAGPDALAGTLWDWRMSHVRLRGPRLHRQFDDSYAMGRHVAECPRVCRECLLAAVQWGAPLPSGKAWCTVPVHQWDGALKEVLV